MSSTSKNKCEHLFPTIFLLTYIKCSGGTSTCSFIRDRLSRAHCDVVLCMTETAASTAHIQAVLYKNSLFPLLSFFNRPSVILSWNLYMCSIQLKGPTTTLILQLSLSAFLLHARSAVRFMSCHVKSSHKPDNFTGKLFLQMQH